MTDLVSGYALADIRRHYLDTLEKFTPAAVQAKLAKVDRDIARAMAAGETPLISIGENCAVGAKLREIGRMPLGGSFFDGTVIRAVDAARLIGSGFCNLMLLKNLEIGAWEGSDSVYDREHRIFYHHYFVFRAMEHLDKSWPDGRRRIDETDIPLFMAAQRARFEYLAEKFLRIARAPIRKVYVWRGVEGLPLSAADHAGFCDALAAIGARSFDIIAVYARGTPEISRTHARVPEDDPLVRWGHAAEWQAGLLGEQHQRATRILAAEI
jgi:hypothetical protein